MHIIDFGFPRPVSKTQCLLNKMDEAVGLINDDWGVVTGVENRTPCFRLLRQIDRPEIPKTITRNGNLAWEYLFHSESSLCASERDRFKWTALESARESKDLEHLMGN